MIMFLERDSARLEALERAWTAGTATGERGQR
jgi:hypothetical protein